MRREEYRAMFDHEERLWWYEGMRAVTVSILGSLRLEGSGQLRAWRILDVGCGTGFVLSWLCEQLGTSEGFGIDVSTQAAEFWPRRGIQNGSLASVSQIPFISAQFDLVTCFDVIYQLSTDEAAVAISEMHRVLKPAGLLLIREPAYNWMRAGHDVAVGTQHRYTRRELSRLLTAQGFDLRRCTYANTLLLWAAIGHRLISKWRGRGESDVKPVPAWLNSALSGTLKFEARLLAGISFPVGLSVIALAQRNR